MSATPSSPIRSFTHRLSSLMTLLILFVGLTLTGCGNGGPSLVNVTGTINVDGKPAEGATMIFFPNDAAMTLIPSAQADAGGKFTVITDGKNGIPTGSYDVTVTWPDPSVKPTESQRMQGLSEPGPDLLAGKYGKKGASGLKVDISASSKELPAFDLKNK
ncbi:MAG: hypothetical protein RL240_1546 [Planctomycetota bacterium]